MGAVFHGARRAAVALLLAALLTGLGAADALASRRPLTIRAEIGSGYVWGEVRDDAYVEVVVRDAVGRLLGRGLAGTYAGAWEFGGFPGAIFPGYRIKATAFNINGKLGVRRLTVPNLTATVNRDTDTVSGKAPKGSRLVIEVFDSRWDAWNEPYYVEQAVKTDDTGSYTHDFSAGGASASVTWSNATGTASVQRASVWAPFIAVGVGWADFYGIARRNVHIEATLTDGAANVFAVGHAVGDRSGNYSGVFADANEEDYQLRAGDWLTVPAIGPDVNWRVPAGIQKVNATTDVVSGECFPGGRYGLYATDPVTGEAYQFGSADASGQFTADLTPLINVTRNSWVQATCWTSEGDSVWDAHGTPPY